MEDDKSKSIKPDFSLDMRGYFCPERGFRTRQKILEMKDGDILEVLADDPVAEEDIKSWVKKTGNDLIFFNKTEKLLKFFICKIK